MRTKSIVVFSVSLSFLMMANVLLAANEDLFERAPWSASAGLGYADFEGDEVVEDSLYLGLKLGYDIDPRWTLEGVLGIMPHLANNDFEELAPDDDRYRLDSSTWGVRLGGNLLFHLRNTENMRWDPYLSLGGALVYYGDDLGEGHTDQMLLGGGGIFYHFDDEWALRADVRTVITAANTEANLLADLSVNWRWDAKVAPDYEIVGGAQDSDGDGLIDPDEVELGTDPFDPDSDDDGLLDGEEVHEHGTDPLNPDSDYDLLGDGAEVNEHGTDPNLADSDSGGVSDGHEVIDDNTNPLDPSDDLMMFTLDILFDYDKASIRPEYYDQLDIIVKVLDRDPGASAKIEGHADKRPKSKADYNLQLSRQRAESVLDYIADVGGIDRTRLEAEGYGFSRPVAPNDSEENMQKNRRTEIYIRSEKFGGEETAAEQKRVQEEIDAASAQMGSGNSEDEYPVK